MGPEDMDVGEEKLYVRGPQRMQGELLVQGSKNAVLPILAATLLGKGVFILHHCPRITDVEHMLELLEETGCKVKREGHMLILDTRDAEKWKIEGKGAGKMRSTVNLLGSILAVCIRWKFPILAAVPLAGDPLICI